MDLKFFRVFLCFGGGSIQRCAIFTLAIVNKWHIAGFYGQPEIRTGVELMDGSNKTQLGSLPDGEP